MNNISSSATAAALSVLVLIVTIGQTAWAADPAFVGTLALAVEEDVTVQLGISDEVKARLLKLIDDREAQALDLAMQIKDLTPEQRSARLRPFAAESERLGMAMLTEEQRRRLGEIRIARAGLITLAEPAIAERLGLSDEQKSKVTELIEKRAEDLTRGGEEDRRITRAFYDRKLMAVLDKSQRAAWEHLAGLGADGSNGTQIAVADEPSDDKLTSDVKPDNGPQDNAPTVTPGDPKQAAGDGTTDEIDAEPDPSGAEKPAVVDTGDVKLEFRFRFAPWKDVLDWFAQQADLSLVLDAPPPGTFNYTDSRTYTPAQAIDLLNSVLLTKGYTLVRRDRMLMLINLEDGIPPNLVSQVPLEELDQRGEFELISCLFQLEELAPADAEQEIRKLLGPQGNIVVLPKAKQIYVTETAGKLRTIRRVIEAVENPQVDEGGKLTTLTLEHVTADEALVVARQLLGLPEDQNAAPDGSLRIAVDPLGAKLFVTGEPESVTRFQEILKLVDVPAGFDLGDGQIPESPQLEVYSVTDADPVSVLQVMQTLMAGMPDVRLATDAKTGNLVALARPSQHATIKATLAQLQRDARQVEVIRLRIVDPQLAVLSINTLFGADEEGEGSKNSPKVDADPVTRQLLIRGTEAQIAQIRSLLEKMGETDADIAAMDESQQGHVRMLPITGRAARSALEQIEHVWPTMRQNRVRVVTPSAAIRALRPGDKETRDLLPPDLLPRQRPKSPPDGPLPRREDIQRDKDVTKPPAAGRSLKPSTNENKPADAGDDAGGGVQVPETKSAGPAPRHAPRFFLAGQYGALAQANKEAPPAPEEAPPDKPADIVVSIGPGGIMIASQDLDALDDFEALLTTLADRVTATGRQFTVFYLRYARADVAAQLLEEVLGGGGGEGAGGGGSLLGDIASNMLGGGGGVMGTLLGLGGGGPILETTGSVTMVPDVRLNALVVQANPTDLDMIEQLLEVIDQEGSPEEVQTLAKPKVIPVYYTTAAEVANVVREVFAPQIAMGSGRGRQPSPEEFIRALRGGRGRSSRDRSRTEQQQMTVGVDERSNSVVVSAPEPLLKQVEQLVFALDRAGDESDETMQVVTINRADPRVIQSALQSIVGVSPRTGSAGQRGSGARPSSARGGPTPGAGGPSAASAQQAREQWMRRMQMFNAMQRGGPSSAGGRPSGGPPSAGGRSPRGAPVDIRRPTRGPTRGR